MSTSASPISSSSASSSSTATSTFTGTSKYSSDLQQVLTNAIALASLPLQQLNNDLTTLNSKFSEVGTLSSDFSAILTAINSVNSGANTPTASVSDSSVSTAQAASSAIPGSYSINVLSPGSATTAFSSTGLPTVSDPTSQSITSAASLTLTVGTSTFTITPSANTLNSLAAAINSAGAGVSATIINIGPSSAPDYRLSIQNGQLGDASIQLNDGTTDLLQVLSLGTNAQYQVNGQPSTPISSTSQTVTIAPGLTASLLAAGSSTITVGTASASSLESALTSFVSAYNAAVTELGQNRGQNGGALAGDSIIRTLQQAATSLVTFTGGSGAVQSLADLGISLSDTGQLSLDQSQLESVVASNPQDVASFLGSATTGGFLQAASNTLNGLEDSNTGIFAGESTELKDQIDEKNQQITNEQDHITLIQNSLTAQISAADALISNLQSQVTEITALFANINGTTTTSG